MRRIRKPSVRTPGDFDFLSNPNSQPTFLCCTVESVMRELIGESANASLPSPNLGFSEVGRATGMPSLGDGQAKNSTIQKNARSAAAQSTVIFPENKK